MQPYQQRVVDEKKELDEKISKLSIFIDDGKGKVYEKLTSREQELLVRQLRIMTDYSEVLAQRIQVFI